MTRAVILILLLVASAVRAEDHKFTLPPLDTKTGILADRADPIEIDIPAEFDVVAIETGEVAPFSGLLVSESRMTELLEAEILVATLTGKLEIKDRLCNEVETVYTEKLREATAPVPWYKTPEAQRWIGFGIGVIVTIGVFWGGAQLAQTI